MILATGLRLCSSMIVAVLLLQAVDAHGQEASTVIGPRNPELKAGADALLAGDIKDGVRLTLLGLKHATGTREHHTAWSNLCAGYFLLDDPDVALDYCDRVLAENDQHWRAYNNRALVYIEMGRYEEAEEDLQKGEAIAPRSRTLKSTRSMLRDAIEPVAPSIIIDDRRKPPADDNDE